MPSPAQLHLMRVLAAQEPAKAAPGAAPGPEPSSLERHVHALLDEDRRFIRAALDEDRRTLHRVQSDERKAEHKREMLPKYEAYVDGVIHSGVAIQDEVIGYVMIWRMDAGDYAGSFAIGRYILEHGLSMPERFSRTPATLIAEIPAQNALRAYAANQPFDIDVLKQAVELTAGKDMPDQVQAKLLFALGRFLAADEPVEALGYLQRAVALNENVGAKKDIERLETRIKNAPGTPAGGSNEPPPSSGT
jgi:hypothetical protein